MLFIYYIAIFDINDSFPDMTLIQTLNITKEHVMTEAIVVSATQWLDSMEVTVK